MNGPCKLSHQRQEPPHDERKDRARDFIKLFKPSFDPIRMSTCLGHEAEQMARELVDHLEQWQHQFRRRRLDIWQIGQCLQERQQLLSTHLQFNRFALSKLGNNGRDTEYIPMMEICRRVDILEHSTLLFAEELSALASGAQTLPAALAHTCGPTIFGTAYAAAVLPLLSSPRGTLPPARLPANYQAAIASAYNPLPGSEQGSLFAPGVYTPSLGCRVHGIPTATLHLAPPTSPLLRLALGERAWAARLSTGNALPVTLAYERAYAAGALVVLPDGRGGDVFVTRVVDEKLFPWECSPDATFGEVDGARLRFGSGARPGREFLYFHVAMLYLVERRVDGTKASVLKEILDDVDVWRWDDGDDDLRCAMDFFEPTINDSEDAPMLKKLMYREIGRLPGRGVIRSTAKEKEIDREIASYLARTDNAMYEVMQKDHLFNVTPEEREVGFERYAKAEKAGHEGYLMAWAEQWEDCIWNCDEEEDCGEEACICDGMTRKLGLCRFAE